MNVTPQEITGQGQWEADTDSEHGVWITGSDHDAPVICDMVPRDYDVPLTDEDRRNATYAAAAVRACAAAGLGSAALDAGALATVLTTAARYVRSLRRGLQTMQAAGVRSLEFNAEADQSTAALLELRDALVTLGLVDPPAVPPAT